MSLALVDQVKNINNAMAKSSNLKGYSLRMQEAVHVVVGLVFNEQKQILIAKRHAHQHQGGKWEFPGGKIEPNESLFDALRRELQEEVGICISKAQPFMTALYHYHDKSVVLHTFIVEKFEGQAQGLEQQPIEWVYPQEISTMSVPMANQIIVQALQEYVTPLEGHKSEPINKGHGSQRSVS